LVWRNRGQGVWVSDLRLTNATQRPISLLTYRFSVVLS
jgi:hypothetical protein